MELPKPKTIEKLLSDSVRYFNDKKGHTITKVKPIKLLLDDNPELWQKAEQNTMKAWKELINNIPINATRWLMKGLWRNDIDSFDHE